VIVDRTVRDEVGVWRMKRLSMEGTGE
jgi:hypothetical protein